MYSFALVEGAAGGAALSVWSLADADQTTSPIEQMQLLDDAERQRFLAFRRPEAARRFAAARSELRQRLAWWLNASPDSLRLGTTPLGKPWLIDHPQCHFSLSHSGDLALLAVSTVPVGVDIEATLAVERITPAVIKHTLTAQELLEWDCTPANEKAQAFTHRWVCKEAVMKATGLGCQIAPNSISVDRATGVVELTPAWIAQVGGNWDVRVLPSPVGYCAALALANK